MFYKIQIMCSSLNYKFLTCKDDIRILHLSSLATFDCLMREIAVTRVSMAEPYSLQDASETLKWDVETYLNLNFFTIIEKFKRSWSLL